MMKPLNAALIGFGFSARTFHLPQLLNHPNYRIKTVLTSNPKNQTDAKAILPAVRIETDYQNVLSDPEIDLVILTVTNEAHYPYTKQALLANKHVICEKPFVMTSQEAIELYELAKYKHRLLRVFHNRKYDGDILTVENLMKTKPFGALKAFHARFDRFVPVIKDNWRYKPGHMSGIYYDLGPHIIHHCVQLFGKPKAVFNQIMMDRPNSTTDDHFEMILMYDNMTCYVGAEPYEREPIPKLKLVGTEATYVKYGFDAPEVVTQNSHEAYTDLPHLSYYMTTPQDKVIIPVIRGQHYLFFDRYYEDIQSPKANDIDQNLALLVIKIMEKGALSAQLGKIIDIE